MQNVINLIINQELFRLSLKNTTDMNYDILINQIGTLIHLYDYEIIDSAAVLKFQTLLEDLHSISNISLEVKPLLRYVGGFKLFFLFDLSLYLLISCIQAVQKL